MHKADKIHSEAKLTHSDRSRAYTEKKKSRHYAGNSKHKERG